MQDNQQSQQNHSNMHYQEDEIDLRELWQTLVKRKVLIAIITLIITVFSIIYVLTKTPIYEAKALIQIGEYKLNNNNNIKLSSANSLNTILNTIFIDANKNIKNRKSEIKSIEIPKKSDGFIEITTEAISNSLATSEINKVLQYVQNKHQKILDDVKIRRQLEIKNIDTKIKNINNKELKLLDDKINLQQKNLIDYQGQLKTIDKNIKLISENNPALAALKLMEKRDLSSFILSLNLQIMEMRASRDELATTQINKLSEQKQLLKSMLLPYNYKNTAIVGKIIVNDNPIKPKKKLIVIVALITGLIFAIFLTFFLNFINSPAIKNKK